MSIDPYIQRRIISLHQNARAQQAAQLMMDKNVGCVLVSDTKGELTGIITDRDLACSLTTAVCGPDIPLSDIMTPRPLSVEKSADIEDVIHLMEECGVRRIPVTERTPEGTRKAIGIVTLDDLIAGKIIGYDRLSRIVRAQITRRWIVTHLEAKRFARVVHRSEVHREQTLNHFYLRVAERVKIRPDLLVQVTEFLLGCLIRRLHYTAAAGFIAQLPKALQEDLIELPAGPDSKITPAAISRELSSRFGLAPEDSQSIVRNFFPILWDLIDPSEIENVEALLPDDFRALFLGGGAGKAVA